MKHLRRAIRRALLETLDQLPGGLADRYEPSDFDPKELEFGISFELEHTDDYDLAREIAMDHLVEDPLYYRKLSAMESER